MLLYTYVHNYNLFVHHIVSVTMNIAADALMVQKILSEIEIDAALHVSGAGALMPGVDPDGDAEDVDEEVADEVLVRVLVELVVAAAATIGVYPGEICIYRRIDLSTGSEVVACSLDSPNIAIHTISINDKFLSDRSSSIDVDLVQIIYVG